MQIIDIVDQLPQHPSKRYKLRNSSDIRQIIVHHSATKPISADGRADAEAFARYHVAHHGWPGIGYDYVIGANGTVYKCNHNNAVNYHAGSANRMSLGICLAGNFDLVAPPAEQWRAAIELTRMLMAAYGVPAQRVIGHREVPAAKSCPGKRVDMDQFRRECQPRANS